MSKSNKNKLIIQFIMLLIITAGTVCLVSSEPFEHIIEESEAGVVSDMTTVR